MNEKGIKVSVIIAAYNAADTISDTLNSLIAQTFLHWEAIVVDDGSNDDTANIVSSFIKKDSRFRILRQQNKGESGARNSGIEAAHFDWMLFLDSDDWILPKHLESLANLITSKPNLDAAYCGWTYCTPDNQYIFPSSGNEDGQLFVQHAGYCFSIVNTYLIKSSLVKEAGGFDLSLKTCADWDMWQRISRTGALFGAVPEVLAVYRIRAGSATRDGYQLFRDGLRVINQGHSQDSRVAKPHPLYINGNSREELSIRKYELACACAGYLIGSKKDPLPLLDLIKDEKCKELDAYSLASCLIRHTMISSSKPLCEWRKIWPEFEKPINDFLKALETCSSATGLAQKAFPIIKYIVSNYSNDKRFGSKIRMLPSLLALRFHEHHNPIKKIRRFGKRIINFARNF